MYAAGEKHVTLEILDMLLTNPSLDPTLKYQDKSILDLVTDPTYSQPHKGDRIRKYLQNIPFNSGHHFFKGESKEAIKLQFLKTKVSLAIEDDWKASNNAHQANFWLQTAQKLMLGATSVDEIKKLIVGGITLAYATNDYYYGHSWLKKFDETKVNGRTCLSQYSLSALLKDTEYLKYHETHDDESGFVEPAPSDDLRHKTFLEVANFIENANGFDGIHEFLLPNLWEVANHLFEEAKTNHSQLNS
jgi:hypothetical protein